MESYKSVTLESMAAAFGVSPDFIDKELADFIVAGRLTAKIDKVAGVIETNRCGAFPTMARPSILYALDAHLVTRSSTGLA